MRYFADTYALVEIVKGNKAYLQYMDEELFTSLLNLYELFYNLLKDYDADTAKELFYEFYSLLLPINDSHIFAAAHIKLLHKKRNVSYVDALGYAIALEENIKFLTGDKAFEKMENVEFVK